MADITKNIVFSGRVQGVGFRFTALNIANRCGLKGYVKNLHDGDVEMLVQGPQDMIDICVSEIQESFAGSISHIDVEQAQVNSELVDFKITF